MRRAALALFTLALGVDAMAAAPECHTLAQLTWLLGRRQTERAETQVYERWAAVSTESWEGLGETRKPGEDGGDRVEREFLRLVELGGEIFYLAKVEHNALPIAFRLTDCGEGHAVFANPAHDFPRRIEYRLVAGALEVHVSDGEPEGRGFSLRFTRR